jgi:hypothetical protein
MHNVNARPTTAEPHTAPAVPTFSDDSVPAVVEVDDGHGSASRGAPTTVPVPRGWQHPTTASVVLDDFPDVQAVTPSAEERLWRLPTTPGTGFDTTSAHDDSGGESGSGGSTGKSASSILVFRGALIGVSVVDKPGHVCGFPDRYASKSERCVSCRWFETRLFRVSAADSSALGGVRYVLHHVGRSIVPGEIDLTRHETARGGHEVVEMYTLRRPNERPFITKPGARVLAQAASLDGSIEDAYINRATA